MSFRIGGATVVTNSAQVPWSQVSGFPGVVAVSIGGGGPHGYNVSFGGGTLSLFGA
jgi:hypothetical protein